MFLSSFPFTTLRLGEIMAEDVKDVLEKVKGLTDTPTTETPKVTERQKKRLEENKKKAEELLVRINELREEYGGLTGDIPLHSEYWTLLNEYRALQ